MHIYCKFLSECSYRVLIAQLIGYFIIQLYKLIFEEDPPCMTQEVMEAITEIANQYASLGEKFIRLFDGEKRLHVLPRYANEKLVMQEVLYHLTTRLSEVLHKKNKSPLIQVDISGHHLFHLDHPVSFICFLVHLSIYYF